MDSRDAVKEIIRRALDGDIDGANELLRRAVEDARQGKTEPRPTLRVQLINLFKRATLD